MAKIIISCAVTGAIHTPSMSEHLPITPEQIAAESIAAAEAGAAIIHLHARDPNDGRPTPDPAVFMQFLPRIKQSTDAVVNITTGGGLGMTLDERLAAPLLASRYISEPLSLDRLAECAPGTLGHGYRRFILDNKLEANLGRNYRKFNEELTSSGKLDRLPPDLSYMMVRGFQIHDFLHVLTGYEATNWGELALAAFYLAQLRFPYHAMRVAVTAAHMAFVRPGLIVDAMDAFVDGWSYGRSARNLNFERWEDELDTPLDELRARMNLNRTKLAA